MRIRRAVIVLMLALLAVSVIAGPAFAGGQPTPPPPWLGDVIVAGLVASGAIFLSVVAIGIANRREHR
jgi:hypothetical protein